ncbi:hypothetical protein LguiB_020975 [Lonicera macranthoides]
MANVSEMEGLEMTPPPPFSSHNFERELERVESSFLWGSREENLREELKQKELTIARVSEENKLNKVVEADIKRNQAMLSQKLEIDFQLMKDDK